MNKQNQWLFEVPPTIEVAESSFELGCGDWETVGLLRVPNHARRNDLGATHSFRSTLFQGDADLLSVLQGRLRLGRTHDPQHPAPIKSRGTAVTKVQEALVKLGYLLPIFGSDGKYGSETYNTVLDYKRKYGIRTETGYLDGIVGPKTVRHLDNALYERKTTVTVLVRGNTGRLTSSPLVTVRLRDIKTGELLGEQRATSPRLTFVIDRSGKTAHTAFRVETIGDPRFWSWKTPITQSVTHNSVIDRQSMEEGNTVQAITPRLRDITGSKEDLVDAGAQTGRVPPDPAHTSCGYPPDKSPLPLLPVINENENACGMDRLLTLGRPSQKALRGELRILSATTVTASADPPGLFLVWIPDGLNLRKANESGFDFHVHFHPAIGADISPSLEYPLGRRRTSKGEEQPYIGKGYSYLLWRTLGAYQHDLAQRSCIYVVPVASRSSGFSKLTAAKLSDYLQEIAVLVRQFIAPASYSTPPPPLVGKVALSGFSFGGTSVGEVLSKPGGDKGQSFLKQNVGEVYFFDLPAKYASQVASRVSVWQKQSEKRIIRMYTQFDGTYKAFSPLVQTNTSDLRRVLFKGSTAHAQEVNSVKGSVVFIPGNLLLSGQCSPQKTACAIPIASYGHDWFVQFFMAHALEASRFERL